MRYILQQVVGGFKKYRGDCLAIRLPLWVTLRVLVSHISHDINDISISRFSEQAAKYRYLSHQGLPARMIWHSNDMLGYKAYGWCNNNRTRLVIWWPAVTLAVVVINSENFLCSIYKDLSEHDRKIRSARLFKCVLDAPKPRPTQECASVVNVLATS